jgi:phosphoglycolate phosphatase-like HAD superfamily hydrolase
MREFSALSLLKRNVADRPQRSANPAGMTRRIMPIRAIVFDFDGVLVESVDIKLDAYTALFDAEGADMQRRVRDFCAPRLGLSRFRLIDAIYEGVLHTRLSADMRNTLCARFGELVLDRVTAAPLVAGANDFLSRHGGEYQLFVVSGTPQIELQEILRRRHMAGWFQAAFGSPAQKATLLAHLLSSFKLQVDEVVYIGDTDLDWIAVQTLRIPFIWRRRSEDQPRPEGFNGPVIDTLHDLAPCLAAMTRHDRPAV